MLLMNDQRDAQLLPPKQILMSSAEQPQFSMLLGANALNPILYRLMIIFFALRGFRLYRWPCCTVERTSVATKGKSYFANELVQRLRPEPEGTSGGSAAPAQIPSIKLVDYEQKADAACNNQEEL